jgi:Mg2+ and Co2+ transporter CorA
MTTNSTLPMPFTKPSANMCQIARNHGIGFPTDTVGNCTISSDDLLLCIIGKMDARIKALEQSEKTADMIADAMMQDRDEQVEKVGEQMDAVTRLKDVLRAVLDSDMAQRGEDEGRESAVLNQVRAALETD